MHMIRPAVSPSRARPAAPDGLRDGSDADAARREVTAGLAASVASVSPKYLYDPLGSRLFAAITELPEYYPTRTERAIFEGNAAAIAQTAGADRTFIDLGAGNCDKARSLFGALRPAQYVAIDISAEFLDMALERLRLEFPALDMLGLALDFSSGLSLPATVRAERRLFFYPGSSIGNFAPLAALALLANLRQQCDRQGGLLIGFDLVKDTAVLEAAYDDALGVTAAFNLNLLNHVNALIGSDFAVGDWRHRAVFNEPQSRIEMHLEARCDLAVRWPGGARRFRAGERIHTENSYKYTLPAIHALLEHSGFGTVRTWTDEREWFAVCHAAR